MCMFGPSLLIESIDSMIWCTKLAAVSGLNKVAKACMAYIDIPSAVFGQLMQ